MKVLAIEISSARGSVAVAADGRVVDLRRFECVRGRGAEVFTALADSRSLWEGADLVALGVGPGAYNGLRVACALGGSLRMATGATIRAVPSPCLLPVEAKHYFVCGDARGGRAYVAEVRDQRLAADISLVPHNGISALVRPEVPVYRVGSLPGAEDIEESAPDAGYLALLAPKWPESADNGPVLPIYLKPPHITMPRDTST